MEEPLLNLEGKAPKPSQTAAKSLQDRKLRAAGKAALRLKQVLKALNRRQPEKRLF